MFNAKSAVLCFLMAMVFFSCGSSPSSGGNSGASMADAQAAAQAALDRMDGKQPSSPGSGLGSGSAVNQPAQNTPSGQSAPSAQQQGPVVNTSRTKPAWVDSADSVYSRSLYIAAVGYASDRTMAEKNALASLVAFFGQSVKADQTIVNTYHEAVRNGVTAGWTDNIAMQNTIQTLASMDTVVGAEIKEVWYDSKSTYYAVAVMEKAKTAEMYVEMIKANQNMIGNLIDMTPAQKNTIEGFTRYQFAGTVADIIGIVFDKIPTYKGHLYMSNIGRIVDNSKVSDHYGLLPTAELMNVDIDSLPEPELNILLLICNKLLCATADKHEYEAVTATVECGGNTFTSRGKIVVSDGWKAIERLFKGKESNYDTADKSPNSESIAENQTFDNVDCRIDEKWTSSPAHYTEDTLLSSMERANADETTMSVIERGSLGTPATRASTIETLIKRGYVERKKKNLVCTEKGTNLIKIVPESVKLPKLTAEWETTLNKIANGDYSEEEFMKQIEKYTADIVAEVAANVNAHNVNFERKPFGRCPKCGGDIFPNSKAYSCAKRCGFVVWRTIAQKAITEAQAKKLLESGKSDKIKGFKSKVGKDFEAVLVVNKDFTVGFDFTR